MRHLRPTVFDVCPDLVAAVDPAAVAVLERAFATRTVFVDAERWDPQDVEVTEEAFAFIVLDGVLVRETRLRGRTHAELLGPGDVATPWVNPDSVVPAAVSWRAATTPASVVVLDRVFLTASARWPALTAVLTERYGVTCARLAVHKAICQLARVEDRITFFLWHAAEHLGRVTPDGLVLPVAMTHEQLGHLIGARRSTVSLALKELEEAALVGRHRDGHFLLHGMEPPFEAPNVTAPRRRLLPTGERHGGGIETLRARLDELAVLTLEAADRTAASLERARAARERSQQLRERARRTREVAA